MLDVFIKIIPLFVLTILGFVLQKITSKAIDIAVLGKLSLYLLTPSVMFLGAYHAPLNMQYLIIPIIIFILLSSTTILLVFILEKFFPHISHVGPSFVSATSNVGYFGLPLILSLYGEENLSLIVLGIMGFGLAENTVGAFFMARGNYGVKKALQTTIKLPNLWAFLLGVILNFSNITLPSQLITVFQQLKITYTTIGMILIGVSFAGLQSTKINWKKVMEILMVKHIWQPLWFFLVIPLFMLILPAVDPIQQKILLIQSFCPVAGNTIVFAAVFKQKTNDIVTALLISTILAFITIPLLIAHLR